MSRRSRQAGLGRRARRPAGAACLLAVALSVPSPQLAAGDLAARLARAAGEEEPLLRVGLEAAGKLFVSSDRPYTVRDAETGEAIWKPSFMAETVLVADGGPQDGAQIVYRVQVGAFASREAAERERAAIERVAGEPAVVRYHPDRGTWRVRVGEERDRDALRVVISTLRKAGYRSAWIVEEPAAEIPDVTIRIVDAAFSSSATGKKRLLVVPSPGSMLRVGGKPYRGIVEVRVSPYGTLRAVNWVGLEAYLRGVVPAELGPEQWPQLEALKAQAVAARTYAWRHRGQFEEEGFDLCSLPRCQVYGGVSSEHPLSDEAVRATRGEILTYEGAPISALYTSTCGGHTEDASEIFPEEAAPYLKAVPCRSDAEGPGALSAILRGAPVAPVLDEAAQDVARAAALLRVAGVLDREPAARYLHGAPSAAELRAWTRALADLAGLPAPDGPPGPATTLAQAVSAVLSDLGWRDRIGLLLSEEDALAILRSSGDRDVPPQERMAVAYLAWLGLLTPRPDGSFGAAKPPSRARIVSVLAALGERYEAFGLREATFIGGGRHTLHVLLGKAEESLPIAPRPWLVARVAGRAAVVETLPLWPGDRIVMRRDASGRVDFVELKGPLRGLSDDRQSQAFSWEVRRTRSELEASINRFVAIGRLEGIEVVRRGRSGRIVELRVEGTEGTAVVTGFDVRNLLDLRDTLAVVEIQRDRSGAIAGVVFSGKGWGHGVGLCQTGAYGMALRGKGYREILYHYYPGTVVESLRSIPAATPERSGRPGEGAHPSGTAR